jgi:hypothetical protein
MAYSSHTVVGPDVARADGGHPSLAFDSLLRTAAASET